MLSTTDSKRKRVSESEPVADEHHHEKMNDDEEISIESIDPSNVVEKKDKIERAKISKLLKLKKEKEEIDRQKRELDYLEKFILNKPVSISEPNSAVTPSSISEFDQIFSRQKAVIDLLQEQGKQNTIRFNVRGKIFVTSRATIEKRENMIKTMLSSNFEIDTDETGAITLDCNPDYFQIILEHMRTGSTTHIGIFEERTEEYLDKFNELLEMADYFYLSKLASVIKTIIKDIESDKRSSKKKQSSLDSCMVSSDREQKEQEYIENFMSLTITEKENADSYFSDVETKLEKERKQLLEREKELLSSCSNPELVFNVRGVRHVISIQKIVAHPGCILNDLLAKVDAGELDNNEILIDRDPEVYQYIFSFLQNGSFTIPNEEHKKKQIYREAKSINLKKMIDYFDPLRWPIETIGQENVKMREEEDYIRELFATDRENPLLNDPYLYLINIFENQSVRDGFKKESTNPNIPLIFNFEDQIECSELTWRGNITKPKAPEIVSGKDEFIAQFNAITCGIFKDADWSNMVIAGGSVCACLLNHSDENEKSANLVGRQKWDEDDASDEEEAEGSSNADNCFTDSDDDIRSSFQTMSSGFSGWGGSTYTSNQNESQKLADKISNSAWKESDIDIFLYSLTETQAEEKLTYLFTLFKKNLNGHTSRTYQSGISDDIMIVRTQHAVTFYFSYPIRPVQIILRIYKSITEVLCGFDIDSVTVAFDGNQVFALPRFKRSIKYRMNLIDPDRQSTTYETRLVKYAKRGFRLAIPGYDPSLIRNEYLTTGKTPFYYRRKYRFYGYGHHKADVSRVTGLARILLYKQAHKYAKNVRKSIVEEGIENAENGHDYKQLCLPYSSIATPSHNYSVTMSVVSYFEKNLGKKPHFECALNDVFSVLHTSGDHSTLEPEVKWMVIEPTTQKIGSFNPTTNNFYKDAYSSIDSSIKPVHRKKLKSIYTWSWQNRNLYNNYDESTCGVIEKAYREYRNNAGQDRVNISDTHYIDFRRMKQISRSDGSRQRAVKRSKSSVID